MSAPVLVIRGMQKHYSALRPLRMQAFELAPAERVALGGLDAAATELFVNLVTGASLPDEGSVITFGRSTADIPDGEAWLASLDRFGIVSPRAVMLEGATVRQNLALPFSLEIDPVPVHVRDQVTALAGECGIASGDLDRQAGDLPAHVRTRVHLARAMALNPQLLLIEHPTVDVGEHERLPLARDMAAVVQSRGASALIMTMDVEFAEVVAHRSLTLEPATGALVPWKRKRRWFR